MQRKTKKHGPLERTKDHVTPKSRGGHGLIVGNTVYCHRKCNEDKANKTLEEYRIVVAARLGLNADKFKFPGEMAWRVG